eukprot:3408963-Prymnesium_polylepis.1
MGNGRKWNNGQTDTMCNQYRSSSARAATDACNMQPCRTVSLAELVLTRAHESRHIAPCTRTTAKKGDETGWTSRGVNMLRSWECKPSRGEAAPRQATPMPTTTVLYLLLTTSLARAHYAMNKPSTWQDRTGSWGMRDGWRAAGCTGAPAPFGEEPVVGCVSQ